MPQYNNPPLSSPLTGGQLAQRFDQLVAATQSGYSGASRPTDLQVGGVWSQVDATAVLYFLYDGTEDKLVKRVDLNTGATSTPESDALLALVTALTDRVDTLEAQAEQRKLPVGAVIKLTSGINPATALGYGVWQRIYNVFPVAAGGAYPLGSTGGRSSQAITAAHMPNHRHRVVSHAHGKGSLATQAAGNVTITERRRALAGKAYSLAGPAIVELIPTGGDELINISVPQPAHPVVGATDAAAPFTDFQGAGAAFSILPPYRAFNFWERTE